EAGADQRDHYGAAGLYAAGRIRGDWLVTLAYDSRGSSTPRGGLFEIDDPKRYYTIYGDANQGGQDAASARKLYVRVERREFIATYGDIQTGLTSTTLSRYARALTGARVSYGGKRFGLDAFAADADSDAGRAEFQGNGLSGPYWAPRNMVINSERVR